MYQNGVIISQKVVSTYQYPINLQLSSRVVLRALIGGTLGSDPDPKSSILLGSATPKKRGLTGSRAQTRPTPNQPAAVTVHLHEDRMSALLRSDWFHTKANDDNTIRLLFERRISQHQFDFTKLCPSQIMFMFLLSTNS